MLKFSYCGYLLFQSLLDICCNTPISKLKSMANIAWVLARNKTTVLFFFFQWDRTDRFFIVGSLEATVDPIFALLIRVCKSSKQSFPVWHLLLPPLHSFHYQLSAQMQGETQISLFELISARQLNQMSDSSCTSGITQCSCLHGYAITTFIIWASQIYGTILFPTSNLLPHNLPGTPLSPIVFLSTKNPWTIFSPPTSLTLWRLDDFPQHQLHLPILAPSS